MKKLFFMLAINLWGVLFLLTASGGCAETVKFLLEVREGLNKPVDVSVTSSGEAYVLDREICKVLVFDPDGHLKFEFGEPGSRQGQFVNPQSIAISPANKIIVADTGNQRVQVFNQAGDFLFQFGTPGTLPGQFKSPMAVAVDQFGLIYVADYENRRVQLFSPHGVFFDALDTEFRPLDISLDPQRNLYVLIPEKGKIDKYSALGKKLQEIHCNIGNKNYLLKAQGFSTDVKGDIYIIDNDEHSIKKVDQKNAVLISFGSQGSGKGQFDQGRGIFTDADNVYIADTNNGRVQKIEILGSRKPALPSETTPSASVDIDSMVTAEKGIVDLQFIPGRGFYLLFDKNNQIVLKESKDTIFGKEGKNPAEFKKPMALTTTLDGKIYVADTGNHRIQIFDKYGSFDYEFGSLGAKAGQFNSPSGIAVNRKGRIYVADTLNHRIQVFNNDGIYLATIGHRREDQKVSEESVLRLPRALAIDSRNQIYVLETENNQIKIYDENGQFLSLIGSKGKAFGQFDTPVDLAIDENNNLYVADQGNHRIQIFSPQQKFVLAFGSMGEVSGSFMKISSVTVAESRIFVADGESNKIQVFQYFDEGTIRPERIYATKTAYPSEGPEENEVIRYMAAQDAARQTALQELKDSLGFSMNYLENFIKLESIEPLNDGQIKVTVSVPKDIPPEKKLAPAKKKKR